MGHNNFKSCLILIFIILASLVSQVSLGAVTRPPQYVLFAFDNCDSPEFWKETLEFSKQMVQENRPLHFTYFMSGVYFLNQSQKAKSLYAGPRHNPGSSDIGFAPNNSFISDRIQQINDSVLSHQEIGSHAVGHFDAHQWTEDDWLKEFKYFYALIADVFTNNNMKQEKFILDPSQIVGFRTPYLAYSQGLWPVLNKYHYRYDTSRTSASNYWPQKISGIWNFPLAELKIAGTAKRTLSMDYNFYVAQSRAQEDPANRNKFAVEMFDTYMNYFADNYTGNRAPVHIGHHFRQMNGGAYWLAMKAFAESVCGLPEVKCVTYAELADFMDTLSPDTLVSYSKGLFQRAKPWKRRSDSATMDLSLIVATTQDNQIIATVSGKEASHPDLRFVWQVNHKTVKTTSDHNPTLSAVEFLSAAKGDVESVTVLVYKNDKEILSATHGVAIDNNGQPTVSDENLESRALLGDLPEAHK